MIVSNLKTNLTAAHFQNVENSRSYMDDLYSNDWEKCQTSIVCIKNSVIGSNKQKGSVIAQGIIPRLNELLQDRSVKTEVRLEACVTVGSLAKGTDDHIEALLKYDTIQILISILEESEPRLIDAALCCLRTLSPKDTNSFNAAFNLKYLQRLLSLAGPGESLLRQSCVATILSTAIKGPEEQNVLHSAGAVPALSGLLNIENAAVRIPVLTCIASMCFENRAISMYFCNATCNEIKVPALLVSLVARDKPLEMQLGAAKCLTNIHRAGAIPASALIITYRALPCLVRICQVSVFFFNIFYCNSSFTLYYFYFIINFVCKLNTFFVIFEYLLF